MGVDTTGGGGAVCACASKFIDIIVALSQCYIDKDGKRKEEIEEEERKGKRKKKT